MGLTRQNSAETPIDNLIDGRYRVLEELGRGAMGIVYRVEHAAMGKIAALKIVHPQLCSVADVHRRFRIEAEAISRLNHPNIVQVFDYGHRDTAPFIVMEYIPGENLGRILARDGPMPLRRFIPLAAQICDALTEAHGLGIIHRDLKPQNIIVSRTRAGHDLVKVVDFGLAKVLHGGPAGQDSVVGRLVGTPYYMSPEQIRGQPVDQRSDVYSLASMIYLAVSGRQAFSANSPMGVLTKHVSEEPRPPSSVAPPGSVLPREIDHVIVQAMAKDPRERFDSAASFKAALVGAANRALSSEVRLTPPPTLPRRRSDYADPEGGLRDPGDPNALLPLPLTRADLTFERRLTRGRYLKLFALLAVVAGLGLLGYSQLAPRPLPTPSGREREPNNSAAEANPLGKAAPIEGQIGARLGPKTPDMDWYRFRVDGDGPQVFSAQISAIPNIDLCLELYDRLGTRLVRVDSAAQGAGEVLTNFSLSPGDHYLLVRQYWDEKDRVPTENITDSYILRVGWRAHTRGWEVEPNDSERQANSIHAGQTLRGYLDRHDDVDTFVYQTEGAVSISAHLSGMAGTELKLAIRRDRDRSPLAANYRRSDQEELVQRVATAGTKRIWLELRRGSAQKERHPGRKLLGSGLPYLLRVERRP